MKRRSQSSSASFGYQLFTAAVMIVVIGLSGSALSARARSAKQAAPEVAGAMHADVAASNSVAANAAFPTTPQTPRRRPISELQSEVITITRHGFEPRELSRPAGPFLLLLENRSGLRAMLLQLKSEDGQTVRETHLTREESDWNSVVNIPPGRYLLTEANHPRWSCAVTITP
jgi:hypothetical protein